MRKAEVLELKGGDRAELEKIARARTEQSPGLWRGPSLLLLKAGGETVKAIADKVGLSRNSARLCLKKYREGGIKRVLHDDQRSGCPASRRACPSRVAHLAPVLHGRGEDSGARNVSCKKLMPI